MAPTRWTYALGALVLASIAMMYGLAFVNGASPIPLVLAILVAVFGITGAAIALRTSLPLPRPRVLEIVVATAATCMSLFLTREMGIPPLVVAAMLATALGVMALPGGPLDALAAGAGYAGAFVGLLTPTITIDTGWVVAAGAIAGLLWTLIGPAVFQGIGGRMGVVAFMGSAIAYTTARFLGEDHNATLLPQVDGMAHLAVIPIGMAGALVTWTLMNRAGWGFNMASGFSSLLVCGVIAMAGPGQLGTVLSTAWFGGTFVGGSTTARLPSAAWVGVAGIVYGAYMLHFQGPLQGHVGVIGVTGTIACFATMGLERVTRHRPVRVLRARSART